MILLGMVSMGVVTFMGYRLVQQQINKYTASAPRDLPSVEVTAEEATAIKNRVESFKKAIDDLEPEVEPLILTADEINALIANNPDLKNRVYLQIKDGKVSADVSFPLDNFPGLRGRYFNGSVTIQPSLENGVLIVKATEASINGEPLPEDFMSAIRNENLAKDLYKNVEFAKFLRRIERLEIEDDVIVLTPKVLTPEEAAQLAEEAASADEPKTTPETSGNEVPTGELEPSAN